MSKKTRAMNRRQVLKGAAAAGIAAGATPLLFRPAIAVPATVKIGLVGPRTGPLALFYEEMSYCIEHAKKTMHNSDHHQRHRASAGNRRQGQPVQSRTALPK